MKKKMFLLGLSAILMTVSLFANNHHCGTDAIQKIEVIAYQTPELYSPPDIAVRQHMNLNANISLVNPIPVEAKKLSMAARPPDIVAVVAMSENRFNVKEVNMGVVEPPDIVLFANEETDRTIIQAGIIKPPDIVVAVVHDANALQNNQEANASTTQFDLNEKIHSTSTKSDQYVLHDVSYHLRC